ncbi:hypothetical protein PYW08_012508 [Mythimna loreyi]|uniref:Uncharacterized protein n=1 Tax=Mythimna loreyi TaxID=667449 RepID=A0ACC2Q360_9NEOP|nr:hypothetical protein PYW08_012508 [Mythimna loreyi]
MLYNFIVFCLFTLCSCGEDYRKVYDLPEGSSCSWNGLEGKCTNLNNCPSAQDAIRRKTLPLICSFVGITPVVCCTICKPADSTTSPISDFGVESRLNQTSKARDNCLKYLQTLSYPCRARLYKERSASDTNCLNDASAPSEKVRSIRSLDFISTQKEYAEDQSEHSLFPWSVAVEPPLISHGKPAYRQQYPHMALLGYGDDRNKTQWLCGGSVISDKFILTAAHCISSPAVGPVKFIALGILKRSDPPELWQIHNVKRIIPHPEYRSPSKYNDIALLETKKTIVFNSVVLPACLPLVPEADGTVQATGWGALGHHKGLADTLQTVDLVRYDAEKCSQLYPKHRHLLDGYNHTTQMCYGDTQVAKDTCEGDSGGPLQTSNEFAWCAYTVLGVTSYGRQCGVSAGSGMYTRVYHYVPWIESQVWP